MKLHHLRMTGIGPFRDTVDIDFSALSTSGMFLLEGPTGSGKSTILDAIVFALYGTVAGQDASAERIRSQFADPSTPSVVDLVLETSHGIFRIRRQPAYDRAKRRGTGTTREQAKAILWRLGSPELIADALADRAGEGAGVEPVSTRLDEVGAELGRALGLSREQFTQTVLLPQNEFARFLRAGSGERQTVLQRVFGTEIYQEVEKQLEVMRREAAHAVAEARGGVDRAVSRIVEAAELDEEQRTALDEHTAASRADALDEAVAEIEAAAQTAAEEAGARSSSAAAAEQSAREQLDEATAALRRIARRRELDALAQHIAEQEPQVSEARRRLARDQAARPAVAALDRSAQAQKRLGTLAEQRDAQRRRHEDPHPDLLALLDGETPLEDLAEAATAATAAAGELTAMVELEERLPARRRALEEQRAQEQTLAQQAQELSAQIEQRPAQKQQLDDARTAAQQTASGLADARLAQSEATTRQAAARRVEQLQEKLRRAEDAATAALETASLATSREKQLRDRRLAGIAAELAAELPEQDPCPVCGSREHPQPAAPADDHVGPEEIETAEQQRQQAETAAAAARTAVTELRTARDQAREAAGDLDAQAAAASVAQADAQVQAAEAAGRRAAELDTQIQQHDAQTAALTTQQATVAQRRETLAARIEEARAALAEDEARLETARGDAASVTAQREQLRARAAAATALREAEQAVRQARSRIQELQEEADAARTQAEADASAADAAETAGGEMASSDTDSADADPGDASTPAFPDDDALHAAVLAPEERARCEQQVTQHGIDRARLADGMAEEGIAEVDASEQAQLQAQEDRAARAAALQEAGAAARAAGDAAARARSRADRTTRARDGLREALSRLGALQDTAGAVVRVADLATGRSADGERIPLSTYVLMRRFEDVVAAANTRLAQFSDGTLELERDTGARGARKTGLDLKVIDHRTDQRRLPETLSGGETFFVSLALALGLADIVTAEAGGVQMDTLFIDEGFGSLDPESLERVVSEIGRLSAGGRTIGIVSHVGEMKAQIAEQIHVRRRGDRSSTLEVTA